MHVTAIDLFAGVGGMSTGATQAGIDVVLAVESDSNAATAYRRNHPRCDIFNDDIRRLPSSTIGDVRRGSSGAIVFGGPPCQGFSYSNTRTRTIRNKNNWLFREFIRVVEVWQPDFFVFENVQGIINTARGQFLDTILNEFARLNYALSHGFLNALAYGVPQNRNRFFLVGAKAGKSVMLPEGSKSKFLTVRDAIADLPSLSNAPENYGDGWLSRDPRTPRLVYKMSGMALPSKRTALVVTAGFDLQRAVRLIYWCEPSRVLVGLQGSPGFVRNRSAMEIYREKLRKEHECHFFELDAYGEDRGLAVIEEEVARLGRSWNVIMSSLGPKLTAISLYRLQRGNPEVGLVYAPSTQFSENYSYGIGTAFRGELANGPR